MSYRMRPLTGRSHENEIEDEHHTNQVSSNDGSHDGKQVHNGNGGHANHGGAY